MRTCMTYTYPKNQIPGYGGFSSAARMLTAHIGIEGVVVSRQQITYWYRTRSKNGFPGMHKVALQHGLRVPQLAFQEVADWYDAHRQPGRWGFTDLPHPTQQARLSYQARQRRQRLQPPGDGSGSRAQPPVF